MREYSLFSDKIRHFLQEFLLFWSSPIYTIELYSASIRREIFRVFLRISFAFFLMGLRAHLVRGIHWGIASSNPFGDGFFWDMIAKRFGAMARRSIARICVPFSGCACLRSCWLRSVNSTVTLPCQISIRCSSLFYSRCFW